VLKVCPNPKRPEEFRGGPISMDEEFVLVPWSPCSDLVSLETCRPLGGVLVEAGKAGAVKFGGALGHPPR